MFFALVDTCIFYLFLYFTLPSLCPSLLSNVSLLPLMASSLSPSVSLVKFEDGEWVLDEPQFVLAIFLDVTALECQLPLEDSRAPAGLDLETVTNRPLARWQIKVSPVSNHFCNACC